jgi:hypothetical protein
MKPSSDGAVQLRFLGAEWEAVPGVQLEQVLFRLVVAQDHVFVSDTDGIWAELPATDPRIKGPIDALMAIYGDWEKHHVSR